MRRFKSTILGTLGLSALLAAAVACTWQGTRPDDDESRRLYIAGDLTHADDSRILAAASSYLDAGFFDMDIDGLRDAIVVLPWVADARVHRRWPDGVVVRVREHRPLALWDGAGVLAEDGALFSPPPDERPKGLPALSGPKGSHSRMLEMLSALQARLDPADLGIERLQLDTRGSWTALLEGGLELRLGRRDVEERLARFAAYGPGALGEELQAAAYVDLRYMDGFAVGGSRARAADEGGENDETA